MQTSKTGPHRGLGQVDQAGRRPDRVEGRGVKGQPPQVSLDERQASTLASGVGKEAPAEVQSDHTMAAGSQAARILSRPAAQVENPGAPGQLAQQRLQQWRAPV